MAGQEEELVEVVKDISKECFSDRIMEQTVEIAVPSERVQRWREAEVPEVIIGGRHFRGQRNEYSRGPSRYRSIW